MTAAMNQRNLERIATLLVDTTRLGARRRGS